MNTWHLFSRARNIGDVWRKHYTPTVKATSELEAVQIALAKLKDEGKVLRNVAAWQGTPENPYPFTGEASEICAVCAPFIYDRGLIMRPWQVYWTPQAQVLGDIVVACDPEQAIRIVSKHYNQPIDELHAERMSTPLGSHYDESTTS